MGAEVYGYALLPPTNPSLFSICKHFDDINSKIDDIRNRESVKAYVQAIQPDIVFHMAAQPLVRLSYQKPVETYEINVMGTVNLLDAIREVHGKVAVVNITTDKCYENREWTWGYRENDRLGGFDPYSNSKACSELVTESYRNSFFPIDKYKEHQIAIATARAGNVIGGGDWALDRLIPDCITALMKKKEIVIRSPFAVRPWQHVLEPLHGYLMLAEALYEKGTEFASSWNFGPNHEDIRPVGDVVEALCELWGDEYDVLIQSDNQPHETNCLKLDSTKAITDLSWSPKWDIEKAIIKTVEWYRRFQMGEDMLQQSLSQIDEYNEVTL